MIVAIVLLPAHTHRYPRLEGHAITFFWAGNTFQPALCAQAFTDHYYNTFDTNRQGLASLYQEQSLLTFEARPCTVSDQTAVHARRLRSDTAHAAGTSKR